MHDNDGGDMTDMGNQVKAAQEAARKKAAAIYWRDNPMEEEALPELGAVKFDGPGYDEMIMKQKREGFRCVPDNLADLVDGLYQPVITGPEEFDNIVRVRLGACVDTLLTKNKEYSRNGDRLWNFRRAGEKLGTDPLTALLGMKVKHDVSIDDLVADKIVGKPIELTRLNEKITDSINYLLLLEALLRE